MTSPQRSIIFDTETTGLQFATDRVIEFAGIELMDDVPTGKVLQLFINPEMTMSQEVIDIHGITNEQAATFPKFKDVATQIIEFIRGAKMIAHNSEFDEKMLNQEFKRIGYPETFWSIVSATEDTMRLSKRLWPDTIDPVTKKTVKVKHKLDAILDRLNIDRSNRVYHGALLDSELLLAAYSKMKEKAKDLGLGASLEEDVERRPIKRIHLKGALPLIEVPIQAQEKNAQIINKIKPAASGMKI